jgi:AraC-like DNA-binding protein
MRDLAENIADRPERWASEQADVLTSVVDTLRLRGRVFCRSELGAPWGLVMAPSDFAHFHVIERGRCFLRLAGARRPLALESGDLVVVPHGRGHTLSDPPQASARPIGTIARGASSCVGHVLRFGGRGAETRLICGAFHFARPDARALLSPLPAVIHVKAQQGRAAPWLESTLRFLADEAQAPSQGTETIVSRLTDVIFVQALRAWIAALPEGAGGWLGALRDRHVGAALGLIHRQPERPWRVAGLAAEVGLSRSPFAARFTTLVGEPPLAYLTRWRLHAAADVLRGEGASLEEAAARVGYDSPAAFSRAFRRQFGTSPGAYRRAAPPARVERLRAPALRRAG